MESEKLKQNTQEEFTNKYDKQNPYYTSEDFAAEMKRDNQKIISNRLDEIDKKDMRYLQTQAKQWNKVLIDEDLLKNLEDFEFWKKWKNNKG
jgi:hypothetical protein